ncbi:MAG: hypothetical protein C5B50_11210 [Verrucomicrobia bacterium]|nr:MAG: hypothetical protein C5B50_11210 [Verrucomicrobiota bacterium]
MGYKGTQNMLHCRAFPVLLLLFALMLAGRRAQAAQSPYIYGIFGYDLQILGSNDDPSEYLSHISAGAGPGWVTATVLVGTNVNNPPNFGIDFTPLANQGVTVICRINNGYFPNGTIPLPGDYDNFASRCTNFIAHSPGCSIWTIGNELNISGEWPYDPAQGKCAYVTPASYATCFRKVYNAIKALHPGDKVLPAAPACYSGPFPAGTNTYGPNLYPYDAMPVNWVQYLNQTLVAIANTGPLDGIALHLASRGYACDNIRDTSTIPANGQNLSSSFLVYKDWVNYGIPAGLRTNGLYATECNGYYYWQGNDPRDFSQHYYAGWMQEVYSEINRYNQCAFATNGPIYRCVNMYRWYDPNNFNIVDGLGESDPYYSQILADLDEAAASKYTWPTNNDMLLAPIGLNFLDPPSNTANDSVNPCNSGAYTYPGVVPQDDWVNLTQGGTGTSVDCGGGVTATWTSTGGGTHTITSQLIDGGNFSLMRGYLDTGDTSMNSVTISGLKFLLYDIITYTDGDNGTANRVTKFTLSGTGITTISKYVQDAGVNFSGTFVEADSTTPGSGAPAGNYCRFHNLRASSFNITSKGDYASDGHPRGPFNALQIVPIDVRPNLLNPSYGGGQFHCFLTGATNINYTIQASTNFVNWTSVSTNPAPGQLNLPLSPNTPYRYYRALFQ